MTGNPACLGPSAPEAQRVADHDFSTFRVSSAFACLQHFRVSAARSSICSHFIHLQRFPRVCSAFECLQPYYCVRSFLLNLQLFHVSAAFSSVCSALFRMQHSPLSAALGPSAVFSFVCRHLQGLHTLTLSCASRYSYVVVTHEAIQQRCIQQL